MKPSVPLSRLLPLGCLLAILLLPCAAQSAQADPTTVSTPHPAPVAIPQSPQQRIDDLPDELPATLDTATRAQIQRGRYVARLGDCVACHTGERGKPMAGGLALETPFGKLYSTNITADRATGIGNYSFAQFDRVMRTGVAADGHHLYPAMPYPSYARISPEDMRDLYVYLMQGVRPVQQANQPLSLRFPFNQRWGMALWNLAFLSDKRFEPDLQQSTQWNRGAYIVQGLGHCGACHTPRGIGFQEKAMAQDEPRGELFLGGATVEHWRALSLRGVWQPAELARLLKSGRNRFGAVAGNMVDVVEHSTQYLSDDDLHAIGVYLASLPPSPDDQPRAVQAPISPAAPPGDLYTTRGGLAYAQFCAACHRPDGTGVKDVFPALAGNPTLSSADPSSLIHIMLTGWRSARTQELPRGMQMPSFARLSDSEIAEILNFTRAHWGAQRPADIDPAQVRRLRAALGISAETGSAFRTPRLADMLAEKDASQLVMGARLNLETRQMLPGHVGNALNCSSCHLNGGTVAEAAPYVGLSAVFPAYAARAGKVITLAERINGCFLRSMNGKPLPLDSQEMSAMVAYFDWMRGHTQAGDKIAGRGVGKVDPALRPDPVHGQQVYTRQCALCHGAQGEGIKDRDGGWIYPPLWGEQSFNIGAGMARTYTAAAFVRRNMPVATHQGFPLGQGGLSEQDALDVAEFFTHQPRPDFAAKSRDWPHDPKPADARY